MKLQWTALTIESKAQAKEMLNCYTAIKPRLGAMDTETTGLHIIKDRPFLFQFGWVDPIMQHGWTYVVDLERHADIGYEVMRAWNNTLGPLLDRMFGHNVKFDMHMSENVGIPYTGDNIGDTQIYIRYGHDALTPEHGGPPMGLKDYCARYVDPTARFHERQLDTEKSSIAKYYNAMLKRRAGAAWKSMSLILSDAVLGYEGLTKEQQQIYDAWKQYDLPMWLRDRIDTVVEPDDIPYNKLDRATVIKYGHGDIRLTLEAAVQLIPVIDARQNWGAVKIDEDVIRTYYEQERVGFLTDAEYMESSRKRMRQHILQQRAVLQQMVGEPIKIGQHAKLKETLTEKFKIPCASTNKKELARTLANLKHTDPDNPAIQFIEVIQELRSLEKWYSVYILRFQRQLKKDNRIYTQINQVGTVSMRVTSDFQQFPREGIKTLTGEMLYNPRYAILAHDGDYDSCVYIDYSQIELRLQAMYTILVGAPEPNLCRAYMPFDCVDKDGKLFDYTNYNELKHYKEKDWFLSENREEKWHPIDVHASSTIYAFDVTPDSPEFKHYRSKGKTYNFMKNYGGGRSATEAMFPEYSDEQIDKIDAAYYKAFPGVKVYHEYCYQLMQCQSYGTNMFGVRYYNVAGHNLINMLPQGSAAALLKKKQKEIYDYSKANNVKSKLYMNIHDELCWLKHKDDPMDVFYKFKEIMEDWPDTLIPIVAEISVSKTNWAEKKDIA